MARRFGMAALRNGGLSEWRPFGMADPNPIAEVLRRQSRAHSGKKPIGGFLRNLVGL